MARLETTENNVPYQAKLVFLSHSHLDKALADSIAELIRQSLHASVFYSSSPTKGLPFGGKFDDILCELKNSGVVLGLITRKSLRSQPVLAEMSVGRDQDKLVLLYARSGYERLLEWPFAGSHSASLDSPEDVEQLVKILAGRIGVDLAQREQWKAGKAYVVTQARHYWPAYSARVWQSLSVLAICLAAALGFLIGIDRPAPQARTVVLGSDFIPVGRSRVRVVLTENLPTRLLNERLTTLRGSLPNDPPNDERVAASARKLFSDVLKNANATKGLPVYNLLGADQLKRAGDLVEAWRGESRVIRPQASQLGDTGRKCLALLRDVLRDAKETKNAPGYRGLDMRQFQRAEELLGSCKVEAGDSPPNAGQSGETGACQCLKAPNAEWCDFVNKTFPTYDSRKAFDNTVFAILQTDSSLEYSAIVPKQLYDFANARWRVEFIGMGPNRIDGGVVLKEELKK